MFSRTACLLLAVVLAFPLCAQAHFLWLVRQTDQDAGDQLHLYFSEVAGADDPDLLDRVAEVVVWQVGPTGEPKQLKLEKGSESLLTNLAEAPAGAMFVLRHDLGVMERGGAKFLLKYYGKTGPALGDPAWQKIDCGKQIDLDLVPEAVGDQIRVTAKWNGKPASGAQFVVAGPGLAKDFEANADERGQASFPLAKAGMYSIRARYVEEKSGVSGGKEYPAIRHYSTLALPVSKETANAAKPKAETSSALPAIPETVTSFGAAIVDEALYVFGGHTGRAHTYYNEAQAHTLRRLDLKNPKAWESLGEDAGRQGLALVSHGGKLYRIGGFTAKNAEGEEHDLWSLADVSCYDPATKQWQDLSPLPEPRSSFDAAVLSDKIYVIGGWQLSGKEDNVWHKTAHVLDLVAATPTWKPLPEPPFQRRALSVAAHDGKLFAIGGMQQEGGPTTRVDIFDPASGTWTPGPSLQGEGMEGFGSAAFAVGGRLFVSTLQGNLQRLHEDGSAWEIVRQLERPRFFHRMLPVGDHQLLLVGGASMSVGKFAEVDLIDVR